MAFNGHLDDCGTPPRDGETHDEFLVAVGLSVTEQVGWKDRDD